MLLVELKTHRAAYHGTSSEKSDKILKTGFSLKTIGSKSGSKLSGVSLTVDKNVAQEHADWAAEKFGGSPVVLTVDLMNLNIMPGSEVTALWSDQGSLEAALRIARRSFDGAELFDVEDESGLEEFEILIFDPKKIAHIHKI